MVELILDLAQVPWVLIGDLLGQLITAVMFHSDRTGNELKAFGAETWDGGYELFRNE